MESETKKVVTAYSQSYVANCHISSVYLVTILNHT
jgi:hypothetical protein